MKSDFKYDSRYNSEYKQRIQETVEYILDLDYGETIIFSKLASILHYNIEDEKELKKFKSQMGKIKNILIDYGYVLKTITNVGYYILKPKQISGYCYHNYIRKTENLLEKSNKILTHTETIDLSDTRKKEYDEVLNLNSVLITNISNVIEVSNYYNNKNIYDKLDD